MTTKLVGTTIDLDVTANPPEAATLLVTDPDGEPVDVTVTGGPADWSAVLHLDVPGVWHWTWQTANAVTQGQVTAVLTLPVPYAEAEDVTFLLGKLGARLPAGYDLDRAVRLAHAKAVDVLRTAYGATVPTFEGDGAEVVRWAEAKLAAAEVLTSLRTALSDTQAVIPDTWRAEARAELIDGVPGYPLGGADPDGEGPAGPSVPRGPQSSTYAYGSIFPDPSTALYPSRVYVPRTGPTFSLF